MNRLDTIHGSLRLPAFLPDATRGTVRTADMADMRDCGIGAVMVNVLHLAAHPGVSAVSSLGGIHRFMGWDGVVACDSGGFQAFSLAAAKLGQVTNEGFVYRFDKAQPKKKLTPEKCVQQQFRLGADILFCLDHCTHPEADQAIQRESVEHTVTWARRCKEAFEVQCDQRKLDPAARPQIFAVVQGGESAALRKECADRLLEIGFDGFGFGGWPIDDEGKLVDMVAHVVELLPPELPKHALGIGKPENLVRAFRMGYHTFDCVIPTRDARHKRLFAFAGPTEQLSLQGTDFYTCVYMQDDRHARDASPIDATCDCPCCRTYSRAYLHHLFEIGEPSAQRLATLHNLRFYGRLMDLLERDTTAQHISPA